MPLTPRQVEASWAYLAGLLDGEGCLSVRGSQWSEPSIEVCMTDNRPLFWARSFTKQGNIYKAKENRTDHPRKTPWHWVVTKASAILGIVQRTQKYLKVKWAEAQVLRIFNTIRRGTKKFRTLRHPQVDRHLKQLSKMLKRGPKEIAYQEALDLCVYLRQAIEERKQ